MFNPENQHHHKAGRKMKAKNAYINDNIDQETEEEIKET
jgi:hypothetical protein